MIKSLSIECDAEGALSASWSFILRDADVNDAPLRHGYMTFSSGSLNDVGTILPTILNKAKPYLSVPTNSKEPLNVLHIGFNGAGLDQNTCAGLIQKALGGFKSDLTSMNIRMANFFVSNDIKRVNYYNFYSDIGFLEDPVCRNMRPTMPQYLEINRLTKNFDLERIPAVGRNAYMFLGKEKVVGTEKKKKDSGAEVLFLRSVLITSTVLNE